jgi:formamidopyrimidine-DNA glycosylase
MVRKLGHFERVDDVDAYVRDKALGPDALDDLDLKTFRERVREHRRMIKPVLTDQKIIAGIGNVYADEVLFQAQIHPRTPAEGLADDDLKRLHRATQRVLKKAIAAGADVKALPHSYLLPHRGTEDPCPRCGGAVRKIKLSNRPTLFCPRCQPAP